jgi:hypothetical protein
MVEVHRRSGGTLGSIFRVENTPKTNEQEASTKHSEPSVGYLMESNLMLVLQRAVFAELERYLHSCKYAPFQHQN